MNIKETIFYSDKWIWSSYLNYLIGTLEKYNVKEYPIPPKYKHNESIYGSKKDPKKVDLITWAVKNNKINLARAVCISSPNYSVLNFLIIPESKYNMPFFGLDFVSLPNKHLLVLDFQPSIKIEKQFSNPLLEKIINMKNNCHKYLPRAEAMPIEVEKFFSPGLVWSILPIQDSSKYLITNILYSAFKEYLNLYLKTLFEVEEVEKKFQKEIMVGQKNYLTYRKDKDPARPMLSNLFGTEFTESLINDILFKVK